jgi:CHAD domain-containing protein
MTRSAATPSSAFSPAATLLLKGLDNRWVRYQDCFQFCRQEFSKEAVHDLRVATRRLLNILEILETIFLAMKGRKLRRELKKQLDSLDELMDTQVQIAYLVDEMEGVEGVPAFLRYLYRREAKLLKDVEHLVRSISIAVQKRRLDSIRLTVKAKLQVPEVRARLIAAVDSSYANVLHRYSKIDPKDTETIHRTRIAFKSFRYAVEVVYPLLVRYPVDLLKAMNDYQGLMGDIQDIEVLLEMLKAFGKKHPGVDVSPCLAFVNERHRLQVETFLSNMGKLHAFWRYTPRQPYPWNKKPESTPS